MSPVLCWGARRISSWHQLSQLGTLVCGPQALAHAPGLVKALGSPVLVSVHKKPKYISGKQGPSEAPGWESFRAAHVVMESAGAPAVHKDPFHLLFPGLLSRAIERL